MYKSLEIRGTKILLSVEDYAAFSSPQLTISVNRKKHLDTEENNSLQFESQAFDFWEARYPSKSSKLECEIFQSDFILTLALRV